MGKDDMVESAPEQQPEGGDLNEALDPADVEDETFVDGWVRKSRADENIDAEMLDLIDEHRDNTSLDEDRLLNALLNHVDEKLENDDE